MNASICRRWVASLALLCLASVAAGAESAAPEFPAEPENWINSGPLTLSALKGKAAFLWFFEEGCPTCRAKWPSLMETAAKYAGKPVLFIGVNSGNSRFEVEQYAKEVGCDWPIIVDGTREYERLALGSEISLQNIYQARVISARGEIVQGNWDNIDGTIAKALEGASWKVDPADVSDSLKPAWLDVEFGNYPGAASLVKKSLNSKKPDIKQSAQRLRSAVQKEMDAELATASAALAKDEKWKAYQVYLTLADTFSGFELPAEAQANKKKLSTDPSIKNEIVAMDTLRKAKKIMATGKPNSHKTVVGMLEKLANDQGATAAGVEAGQILARFNSESGGSK